MKTFIHIPKNGGMSIRHGLRGRIQPAGFKAHKSKAYSKTLRDTMAAQGDHHGAEHSRWLDIKPEFQGSCFAIVRNPWSRVASRFLFAKLVIAQGKVPESYADVSSFPAFLEERHKWGEVPLMWHRAVRGWFDQLDYVTDHCAKVKVRDILRTEHLDEEVERYMKKKLPRRRNVTVSNTKDWKSLYTEREIQIVADWHKRDIEHFGFDFNTPATRNTLYA